MQTSLTLNEAAEDPVTTNQNTELTVRNRPARSRKRSLQNHLAGGVDANTICSLTCTGIAVSES